MCVEGFSCLLCEKPFKSKKSLQQHLKHMHVEVKRCVLCIETFSTERKLLKLIIRNHRAGQEIKCGICSTVFRNKKSYSVHKAKRICTTKEKNKADEKVTVNMESVVEEDTEYDQEKNKSLDNIGTNEKHESDRHCAGSSNNAFSSLEVKVSKKTFPCENCAKVYKSDRGLRGHKQTHKILNAKTAIVSNDLKEDEEVEEVWYYHDDHASNIIIDGAEGTDYFVMDYNGN